MTRKGFLLIFATLVSVVTGYRPIWDNPDYAFFIGLILYLPAVAAAQFYPIATYIDRVACRLLAYGVINYIADWIFNDPYNPAANEYIFLAMVIAYEWYKYRKHKKAEADKLAGRYK